MCCLTHLVAKVHQQHGLWKTDECNKHLERGENRQTERQKGTKMREKQRLCRKKQQGQHVSHCLRINDQTEGNTTMANVSECVFQPQALLWTMGWFLVKLTGFCYMKVTKTFLKKSWKCWIIYFCYFYVKKKKFYHNAFKFQS